MNLREVILMTIEAGESGRPGAVVELLKAMLVAVDAGKTDNFFNNDFQNREIYIALAQKLAITRESTFKARVSIDSGNNAA